jgi:pimeloyl-ACP methyl ester carboxylesterase
MTSTTTLPADMPELAGVRHHYIDLPGLRMHVAEAGRGEPVLLLHGFPQHWWEWRGVISGLAERYRVLAPDLRGAGWTDAPPAGYDRHTLLADLLGLIDALGLRTTRVLAHDYAAVLGFQLCLTHPDRVRAFVSLSVPHPWIRFDPRMLRSMHEAWYQFAIIAPGLGPRLLRSGRQRLPRFLLGHHSAQPDAFSASDVETFMAPLREPARARAGCALYRHFIQPELVRILHGEYRDARLTTPTLVLTGAEDRVVRANLLGGYEANVDAMDVQEIAGASHYIVDDQPEAVLNHALELFARA